MAEVEHTVAVTAYFERERDDYLLKPPTTYAVIEVKPPIDPGDDFTFKRAILGQEWCLVDLRKLFATASAIVFLAESSIPDQDHRHEDIAVMARRIGELANNPQAVLRLMEDRPFPEQPKPTLELGIVQEERLEERPTEEEPVADLPGSDDLVADTATVHLAPVSVPPLTISVPALSELEDGDSKVIDFPPVTGGLGSEAREEPEPSVFGPAAARLTGFAPKAPPLPWPPQTGDGRHARKDQTDN